jgi:hypothetical protein
LIIDLDDNDLSARMMLMEAVTGDAKQILEKFARTDQTEDEAGHSCPKQQLPRLPFQAFFAAGRHLRLLPSFEVAHAYARKG